MVNKKLEDAELKQMMIFFFEKTGWKERIQGLAEQTENGR
jgi:hypothetical protein